jgi:hypothetical protein
VWQDLAADAMRRGLSSHELELLTLHLTTLFKFASMKPNELVLQLVLVDNLLMVVDGTCGA